MSKKILVLNGSPRLKGNTAMLCDALAKGAQGAGHVVNRFDLKKMNILDCLGCLRGGNDMASPCVQKDDMDQIYQAYREADIIVLASPLYWQNLSSLLKRAFDRLYAFYEYEQKHAGENYKPVHKESVLIIAAGLDNPEELLPVKNYYEALVKLLNWQDRGSILASGVIQVGDIKNRPELAEAEKLGASL